MPITYSRAPSEIMCRDEKTGQMFWDWPEPAKDDGTAPLPFPEVAPTPTIAKARRGRA